MVPVYETTGVRRVMTLVYPAHASAALDRVSVLHPAGMALLGARPGKIIEPGGPGGKGRLRLEKILHHQDSFSM